MKILTEFRRENPRILLFLISLLLLASLPAYYLSFAESLSGAEMAPRSEQEQRIIDIYRKYNGSVVFVTTREVSYDFFGPMSQEGTGSGVVIDVTRGLVASNYHVVEGALGRDKDGRFLLREGGQISATLGDGKPYLLQPVGADPENDLALLQIVNPPSDLVAIPLADSDKLEVGQRVLAIGNPFGLSRSLTDGIISSLGRSIQSASGRKIDDVIQTDAAINPGNSGGPLLDMFGRMIGINTAIASKSGEYAGIGFAIPANLIRRVLPQLMKFGRVLRPKIGAALADTSIGSPIVQAVIEGGPAAQAGIQGMCRMVQLQWGGRRMLCDEAAGDIVVAINGKTVRTKSELLDEIERVTDGGEIELTVVRGSGGKSRKVTLRPVLG